jgi:NitT/TauT family transport system substrate-binding protein
MGHGLWRVGTVLVVAAVLACGPSAPRPQPAPTAVPVAAPAAPAPPSAPAAPAERATLHISHSMITSSAGNYVAADRGYFAEEGIDVEFVRVMTGTETMALIVSGQTDVGGGLISSGLYNAFARGIQVKIVADHGANLPNASAGGMAFRKDLFESGVIREAKDLRGRKVAIANEGGAAHITLDRYLQAAGLALTDVDLTFVPLADTAAAFQNRVIEAAYWQEPFTTIALEQGLIVRGPIGYEIYPQQQIGGIMFAERLTSDRALGLRYMRAYVRGVRDYVNAMQDRDPATFDAVVPILMNYTTVKDRALFDKAIPSGLRPDPTVNVESIIADQEWYLAHGYVTQRANVEAFVDLSFVEQAIRELGPYR